MITRRIKSLYKNTLSAALEPALQMHDARQAGISRQIQILLSRQYREQIRVRDLPPDFDGVGFNFYSATNEDGILLYIFSAIGMKNRKCVDIGAGTVEGSNTANLIINHGFSALLIDGSPYYVSAAREFYAQHRDTRLFPPTAAIEMVTAENINAILSKHGYTGELDLLCLDIDGVDYWIWKAIDAIQPRVVVAEYQDILGPDRSWTVPYKADFNVKEYAVNASINNYCGASLRAFVKLGWQKGYRLVGCSRGGWNAFFVKAGLAEEILPEVTVESCFKYECNRIGMEQRFPLVKDLKWEEV